MNFIPSLISRRIILPLFTVVLLGLGGCCTTPPSVTAASAQAKREAVFLGKQQDGVLDAFTQFTTDAEKKIRPVIVSQHNLLTKVGEARLAGLNAVVDASEASLKLKFESEVVARARTSFADQLESSFHAKLNPKIKQFEADAALKQDVAAAHPGDPDAQAASRAALVKLEQLQLGDALAELELRDLMENAINQARAKSFGEIETAMNGLRDQLSGKTPDGPLAESAASLRTVPALKDVTFSAQREEISGYKTQVAALHQLHLATLKATDDYLARPSEVKLAFDGAFDELKGDLKKLTPKLGPLAGAADKALDGAFSKLQDAVTSKTEELSGKIESSGESLLNRLLSEITSATNKLEKTSDSAK